MLADSDGREWTADGVGRGPGQERRQERQLDDICIVLRVSCIAWQPLMRDPLLLLEKEKKQPWVWYGNTV